ncbi:aminotransferase class I/II-fold pyridoxal phosphate-dependent enzyme [Sulfitobacter sp. S223]|uniref:aminotransferase class I/II-fold pyridoxal phosphate-dependent enzyme n=1 Tax=Sulfitobacter sp. S223 TaxID=2867023 RepID=UPI0021A54E30|nr:aminotransferase class I/II-fold pyridoxal phosphate-dependent enzyme [Sulfitobacter sp. S223]UWR25796.1 aminotransferase class I/II-fold pyridoxal phosphate-dependent enzyme [Sulfitobacter sp. S223]
MVDDVAVVHRCFKQVVTLIDIASQGFGQGLDDETTGLRLMAHRLRVVLVAFSGSKNMGLYCERIGAANWRRRVRISKSYRTRWQKKWGGLMRLLR